MTQVSRTGMLSLTRKALLKGAGAAGVAALGFLYPGAGSALASAVQARPARGSTGGPGDVARSGIDVRRLEGVDASYAGGEVVTITEEGIVLLSAEGTRAVRIARDAVVWKEFDLGPEAIDFHDWVDAKGTPLSDGSLLARSGWIFVNIGRSGGVISSVSAQGVTIRTSKSSKLLEFSRRLEVVSANDESPLDVSALSMGSTIGAVGLRLPDRRFRATRIWIE